ncbi:hypothetical protein LY76DRAFT_112423 [Colletotrichum caudatum]|nr:hypothetical protein LY76DRAFT_112423 [Colletotrichum caudatum]
MNQPAGFLRHLRKPRSVFPGIPGPPASGVCQDPGNCSGSSGRSLSRLARFHEPSHRHYRPHLPVRIPARPSCPVCSALALPFDDGLLVRQGRVGTPTPHSLILPVITSSVHDPDGACDFPPRARAAPPPPLRGFLFQTQQRGFAYHCSIGWKFLSQTVHRDLARNPPLRRYLTTAFGKSTCWLTGLLGSYPSLKFLFLCL